MMTQERLFVAEQEAGPSEANRLFERLYAEIEEVKNHVGCTSRDTATSASNSILHIRGIVERIETLIWKGVRS